MWFQPESDSQINGVSPWASPQQSALNYSLDPDPSPQVHQAGLCPQDSFPWSTSGLCHWLAYHFKWHCYMWVPSGLKEFVLSLVSAEYKAIVTVPKSQQFRVTNYNALAYIRCSSRLNFGERWKRALSFEGEQQIFFFFALRMILFFFFPGNFLSLKFHMCTYSE